VTPAHTLDVGVAVHGSAPSSCYLDDISSDRAINDRLSTPQRAIELSASRGYRLVTNRDARGARPDEWLLGLEPDPLAVIGDPRRCSTSTPMED